LHPTGTCDDDGAVEVGATANGGAGSYTVVDEDAGTTLFFACDIGSHCNRNQYLEVDVVAVTTDTVEVDWFIPSEPFDPITVEVGTTINFAWNGFHNVFLHPTGTCDEAGAIEVGATARGGEGSYTVVDEDAGTTLFFACDIGSHCNRNQYLEVDVVAEAGTPAPTPAPTPEPSSFFPCFSSETLVETQHRGPLRMDQLKIGDTVLVDERGRYETIYSFGHFDKDSTITAAFLQISTSKASGLEITPNHFLFMNGNKAVPASTITVGDEVMMASGETDTVISITQITRRGIFAPFTPSGTIVTNGIKSSSFATVQEDSRYVSLNGITTPITYHQLGLVYESPHRLFCHFWLHHCATYETYNEEAMSQWVAMPSKGFQWLLDQNIVVSGVLFFGLVGFWCTINIVEMMILNPLFAVPFVLLAFGVSQLRRVKKKVA